MNSKDEAMKRMSMFGDFILYPDEESKKKNGHQSFFSILSGPLFISWTVTRRCNLKCLHCLNNCGNFRYKELDEIGASQIVEQIIEVNPFNVCFCGGEPLLRKDLHKIANRLSKAGMRLSMVTNGWFLTKEKLKLLNNAGIFDIQISLDGASSESHDYLRGVLGSFNKAIEAIKNLVVNKMNVTVAFTPTKFNIFEFPKLVKLLISLKPISLTIRLQPVMSMGRCIENEKKLIPSSDDYIKLVWKIRQMQIEYLNHGITIEWGDPLEHIHAFGISGESPSILDIDEMGNIRLSPYLPILVGDLKKQSIKEYWNKDVNKKWLDPKVKEMAEKLVTLEGMKKLSPLPYYEPNLIL